MKDDFQMKYRKSRGNIHIELAGSLGSETAWRLIRLIHDQYDGRGRVFIDTRRLSEVLPGVREVLQKGLDLRRLPPRRLFFKGETGMGMAPQGSRVLIVPLGLRCRCGKKRDSAMAPSGATGGCGGCSRR